MSNQYDAEIQKARQTLATFFEDVAGLEKDARDMYDGYLIDLVATKDAEIVTHIRDQEIGHMRIADELLHIIKPYVDSQKPSA